MVQPIGVRDEGDGSAVEELEEVFARLAPEVARDRPTLRDLTTIRAGVEVRRENVSEVWAWLAHPGLAVRQAEKLFRPATFTAVPRVKVQCTACGKETDRHGRGCRSRLWHGCADKHVEHAHHE